VDAARIMLLACLVAQGAASYLLTLCWATLGATRGRSGGGGSGAAALERSLLHYLRSPRHGRALCGLSLAALLHARCVGLLMRLLEVPRPPRLRRRLLIAEAVTGLCFDAPAVTAALCIFFSFSSAGCGPLASDALTAMAGAVTLALGGHPLLRLVSGCVRAQARSGGRLRSAVLDLSSLHGSSTGGTAAPRTSLRRLDDSLGHPLGQVGDMEAP
jgi:hypothetical protein